MLPTRTIQLLTIFCVVGIQQVIARTNLQPASSSSFATSTRYHHLHHRSLSSSTTTTNTVYYNTDDAYSDSSSNPNSNYDTPVWLQMIFVFGLVGVLLVLCMFLPLCYPLSLWDLVSVYIHWEECDAGEADYTVHPCDIMVC